MYISYAKQLCVQLCLRSSDYYLYNRNNIYVRTHYCNRHNINCLFYDIEFTLLVTESIWNQVGQDEYWLACFAVMNVVG